MGNYNRIKHEDLDEKLLKIVEEVQKKGYVVKIRSDTSFDAYKGDSKGIFIVRARYSSSPTHNISEIDVLYESPKKGKFVEIERLLSYDGNTVYRTKTNKLVKSVFNDIFSAFKKYD